MRYRAIAGDNNAVTKRRARSLLPEKGIDGGSLHDLVNIEMYADQYARALAMAGEIRA